LHQKRHLTGLVRFLISKSITCIAARFCETKQESYFIQDTYSAMNIAVPAMASKMILSYGARSAGLLLCKTRLKLYRARYASMLLLTVRFPRSNE
jgi:hypothetical protein